MSNVLMDMMRNQISHCIPCHFDSTQKVWHILFIVMKLQIYVQYSVSLRAELGLHMSSVSAQGRNYRTAGKEWQDPTL